MTSSVRAAALGLLHLRVNVLWAVASRRPAAAVGIALGAAAFYGLFQLTALSWVAGQLEQAAELALRLGGATSHLTLAALVQLVAVTLCIVPLATQLANATASSQTVRLFRQTVRDDRAVALALTLEASLSVALFVDAFLLPVVWSPFVHRLSGAQRGWLVLFQLAACGIAVLLALFIAAIQTALPRSRAGTAVSWLIVLTVVLAPLVEGVRTYGGAQPGAGLAWVRLLYAGAQRGSLIALALLALAAWGLVFAVGQRAFAGSVGLSEAGTTPLGRAGGTLAKVRPPPTTRLSAIGRLCWQETLLVWTNPWRVLFLGQAVLLYLLPGVLTLVRGTPADEGALISQRFLVLLSAVPALAVATGSTMIVNPAVIQLRWERGATLGASVGQVLGQTIAVQAPFSAALLLEVGLGLSRPSMAALLGWALTGCSVFLGFFLVATVTWLRTRTESPTLLGIAASVVAAAAFGCFLLGVGAFVDLLADPRLAFTLAGAAASGLSVAGYFVLRAVSGRMPRRATVDPGERGRAR